MKSSPSKIRLLVGVLAVQCLISKFVIAQEDSVQAKRELKVAFLLPFHSKKVFISNLNESVFYFPEEAQVSVEFYQGALLALDSLKQNGLNATVHVYDTGNDSSAIDRVLRNEQLKDVDFILGPLGGAELKAAAEFAKHDSIPLISPLSATFFPADTNQFFILSNAGIQRHCEAIYDYLLKHELTHRIVMVYRHRPQNLELVKYIKDYRDQIATEGGLKLRFIDLTDSTKNTYLSLRDSLFTIDTNIILIPSSDEPFVRYMMRKLMTLKDDYPMKVYGMPTWSNYDQISSGEWDSTNVILTSSFYLDKSNPRVEMFRTKYSAKYNVNPTEYAVRGYDEMFFIASAFMDGKVSPDSLCSSSREYLASAYRIEPVMKDSEVLYYENQSVFFLRNENGKWMRIREKK